MSGRASRPSGQAPSPEMVDAAHDALAPWLRDLRHVDDFPEHIAEFFRRGAWRSFTERAQTAERMFVEHALTQARLVEDARVAELSGQLETARTELDELRAELAELRKESGA